MSMPLRTGSARSCAASSRSTSRPGSRSARRRSSSGPACCVSPSTVRAELAELERLGLLTHPHTSAGRVPTEAGYRIYVDGLLARQEPRPPEFSLGLAEARGRGRGGAPGDDRGALAGDAAARARLGAAARGRDGPARRRAPAPAERRDRGRDHLDRRGRRSSATRSRAGRPRARRAGRGEYLRERADGTRLGRALLARAFDEPSLSAAGARVPRGDPRRRSTSVEEERQLYVGGAAGLLDDLRSEEIGAYRSLMDALEKRAALLDVLAQSLTMRRAVRARRRRARAVRACTTSRSSARRYGLANQTLGAVSLLGPLRMDYEKALRSVRSAAHELSRFVEEVYEAE